MNLYMKLLSIIITILLTLFLNSSTFSQLPDLTNYEFYSAYIWIQLDCNVQVIHYMEDGSVTDTWISTGGRYFNAMTEYDPYINGGKNYTINGKTITGFQSTPDTPTEKEENRCLIFMGPSWSKVSYFEGSRSRTTMNSNGGFGYSWQSQISGIQIPYYNHISFTYENENYLKLNYRFTGIECKSKILSKDFIQYGYSNGILSDKTYLLDHYGSTNDLINIYIYMKKVEAPYVKLPAKPSDQYTGLRGSIGTVGNTFTVLQVNGDAELLHEGEEDQPVKLKPGQKLSVSDRIYTGMETEVVVQTPEGSIYTIRELTDVKLSFYNMDIESIRTRLWLKSGEVTKNTDCHCGIRSDFAIRTPQATCSVRGTSFSVSYDSLSESTHVYVTDGSVMVSNEGYDSTEVAGIHFQADSVQLNAWEGLTITDHEIGAVSPLNVEKLEISPDWVHLSLYGIYVFSPLVTLKGGEKVPVLADWEVNGGEIYDNGIFVSNGEMGVYSISCHEPMNGLNATASVAIGFPLPDSTHVFTLSSLPDVIPGDTLWAYVHLGTPRDTVANLNLIKFDLDFTNTEFLEMTDTASSIRVGEWASEAFELQVNNVPGQGKIECTFIPKTPNSTLSGSGDLLKLGLVADVSTPALTEIDFSLANVFSRDTSGSAFITLTNSSRTLIAERVGTPEIIVEKTDFIDSTEVRITNNDNSKIFYTLNGFAPTVNDSLFSTPFYLDTSMIIKAKAFKEHFLSSFTSEKSIIKNLNGVSTVVIQQPESLSICEGGSAEFFLEALGTNLNYQWIKNGINIIGANEPSYLIENAEISDIGNYACIVVGKYGNQVSETAILDVFENIEIVTQPEPVNISFQETAKFTVIAEGGIDTYQWFKNDEVILDSENIFGSNSNELTITEVSYEDEGFYKCKVTGVCDEKFTETVGLSIITQISNLSDFNIILSPNPSNQTIHLTNIHDMITEIIITDQFGREVLNRKSDFEFIDISSFKSGFYCLKIEMNKDIAYGKFIKF